MTHAELVEKVVMLEALVLDLRKNAITQVQDRTDEVRKSVADLKDRVVDLETGRSNQSEINKNLDNDIYNKTRALEHRIDSLESKVK